MRFKKGGQARNGWMLEKLHDRERTPQSLTQLLMDAQQQEGLTTQIEEIVLNAKVSMPEGPLPNTEDSGFQSISRGHSLSCFPPDLW